MVSVSVLSEIIFSLFSLSLLFRENKGVVVSDINELVCVKLEKHTLNDALSANDFEPENMRGKLNCVW
jgi:hypothetical protein